MNINNFDETYHDLLIRIRDTGFNKGDRTGTGTRSLFGEQIKFDLREGFPLLTTKKMFTKGIIHELLFFIRGATNNNDLLEEGVRIWDAWSGEGGELGPIYSTQWRSFGPTGIRTISIEPAIYTGQIGIPEVQENQPTVYGIGYNPYKKGSLGHTDSKLLRIWRNMINRVYVDKSKEKYYKDVEICTHWLNAKNFIEDAKKLQGYSLFTLGQADLDKDYWGSKVYSPDTCIWLDTKHNKKLKNFNDQGLYIFKNKDTQETIKTLTVSEASNYMEGSQGDLRQVVTGERKQHLGWYFEGFEPPPAGKIWRFSLPVDQLKQVINRIKTNPNCRRQIVTAWNPPDISNCALPPCHCFFQFNVQGDTLHMQMYQRSADVFLGVPFNIASYAMLLEMVAQVTGLTPGVFTHTFGDVHIYNNHFDQVEEQLSRIPFAPPRLSLSPGIMQIDDFQYGDILVLEYESHGAIKAEVSV